jgi:tetratricopeptide (TPR) repeat protein
MSKLNYAVVLASLVASPLVFSGVVNAQLTGSYGSAGGSYAVPGASWQWMPNNSGSNGQNSQSIDSLYEKASDERHKGNYAAAFQIYDNIVALDPQEAQAYFNRGSIKQSKLDDRVGAMEDFQIAVELFRQQGDKYMTRASMEHIQELRER